MSAQDLNRITVAIQGSDGLDGTYQRLSGSLQSAVLQTEPRVRLSRIQLSGLFRSDSGVEIVFSSPEFTYRSAGSRRNGGYAVYELGASTLLELRFVDDNRLPLELSRYRATYVEKADDNRVIRTLSLEPGTVGISGFRPSGEPTLVLEQIETVQAPGG